MQYFVFASIGQLVDGGKAAHETFEVADDGRHLGLLQHDLRHPHSIRANLLLPRQVLAAAGVKPAQESVTEIRGHVPNSPLRSSLALSCSSGKRALSFS